MQTRQLPTTGQPGNRNQMIADALRGIDLYPWLDFAYENGTTRRFEIVPAQTGNGDSLIRIPVRSVNADRLANGSRCYEMFDRWWIDLDTTVIDLDTSTGGIVDGSGLLDNTYYLLWAFFDQSSTTQQFQGYGLTKVPVSTGATIVAPPAARGTQAVITVTGDGLKYTVGARVLLNQTGRNIGDNFNQGKIVEQAENTITVDLDSPYGAINETNTTLTAAVITVTQLDRYEPRVGNTGETYEENRYSWEYLGSVLTNGVSNVRIARKARDQQVIFVQPVDVINQVVTAGTTPVTFTLCLARWLPFGTRACYLTMDPANINPALGEGYLTVGLDLASPANPFPLTRGDPSGATGISFMLARNCSVYVNAVRTAQNPEFIITLTGATPQGW